jgi:serine/threonine protein kinase
LIGPPDTAAGVRPGDVLVGKYRVERVLGAGGMGVVVAAHHIQLDEKVALKFLLPEALQNHEAIGRFVREARAAVKIKGEHVARVSDVGQLENGAPYIVMEYLDGIDLAAWLKQRGALPTELAVDFVLQTCEAIAEAHLLGIVHRDLKPANLFCVQRADGQLIIKVLDFGISKVTTPGAVGHEMTRTNAMVGSPYYMSPEQMQSSKAVDARTDIWSLGIILFELMVARTPFAAESVTELAIKVTLEPTPPLRAFRADVAPGLEQVIATCLEKQPSRRYQTVGDLALMLRPFASLQGRLSVDKILGTLRQGGMSGALPPAREIPPPLTGPPATAIVPNTAASWGHASSSTRPGGKAAITVVAALLTFVVLVTGGALVLRWPPMAKSPPAIPASAAAPRFEPPASTMAAPPVPTVVAEPAETLRPAAPVAVPTLAGTTSHASPSPRPNSAPRSNASAPVASSPSAATPAAKPNCDPPYYFDKGARIFKKECL